MSTKSEFRELSAGEHMGLVMKTGGNAFALFEMGNHLLRTGKWREASLEYEKCLADRPGFLAAEYNITQVCAAFCEWQETIDRCLRILARDPDLHETYLILGRAFTGQGKIKDAAGSYLSALAREEKSYQARLGFAEVLFTMDQEDLGAALRETDAALQQSPYSFVGNLFRAELCALSKDHQAAMEAYMKTLRIRTESRLAALGLAASHLELGKDRMAQAAAARAAKETKRKPFDQFRFPERLSIPPPLLERAHARARHGVALFPDHWEPRILMALVLEEKGRLNEAIEIYEEAQDRWGGSPDLTLRLGHLSLKLGRTAQAVEYCRAYLEHDPNDARVLIALGKAHALREEFTEALEFLERVRATGDLTPDVEMLIRRISEKVGGEAPGLEESTGELTVEEAAVEEALQVAEASGLAEGPARAAPVSASVAALMEEAAVEEAVSTEAALEKSDAAQAHETEAAVVKVVSEQGTVVEAAAVEKAALEEAAPEKAVIVEAPVEEAPVEKPQREESPVAEAPVEEPAHEQAPAAEALVEKPTHEIEPVEEAPVEKPSHEDAPAVGTLAVKPLGEVLPPPEAPLVEPGAAPVLMEPRPSAAEPSPADDIPEIEPPPLIPVTSIIDTADIGANAPTLEDLLSMDFFGKTSSTSRAGAQVLGKSAVSKEANLDSFGKWLTGELSSKAEEKRKAPEVEPPKETKVSEMVLQKVQEQAARVPPQPMLMEHRFARVDEPPPLQIDLLQGMFWALFLGWYPALVMHELFYPNFEGSLVIGCTLFFILGTFIGKFARLDEWCEWKAAVACGVIGAIAWLLWMRNVLPWNRVITGSSIIVICFLAGGAIKRLITRWRSARR